MGEPKSFTLLELGPGRGTLMADALRAANKADGFENALHLQLFETNGSSKEQREKRLGKYAPYWASEIDAVSDDPLFVVANEFFDALPIRQFVRADDGWHERLVGLMRRPALLRPCADAHRRQRSCRCRKSRSASPRKCSELATSTSVMQRLAARSAAGRRARHRLRLCFTQTGETLQAVKRHAFADPLEEPGTADISAHVDFGALSEAASKAGLTVNP